MKKPGFLLNADILIKTFFPGLQSGKPDRNDCMGVTHFFYKHAIYKHVRLKFAKKLGTLLSTPQAEILGKSMFLFWVVIGL